MKTIALIHYAYPPKIGGVERLMSEQAAILAGFGYPVHIVTGSGKEDAPGIMLTEIPHLQAVRKFNPQLQERLLNEGAPDAEFAQLAQEIENALATTLADADVIIVHNMLTLVHNLPFIAAFKVYAGKHPKKKVLVWTHDQTYVDNNQVVMKKVGVNLSREMKTLLLTPVPGATYVVISETFKGLLTEVMAFDPALVQVIPNGIHMKKFLEIDDSIWQSMQKEKLEGAFPIILSPVNILQRKNLEYCLDIVAQLMPAYPAMRYLISGASSEHRDTAGYEAVIKKKITDLGLEQQVLFIGDMVGRSMTDAEIHDLYDIADVIFYFSKQENFGLPILEAGLSKTPIWVSDLPVFHEIGGNALTYVPEGQSAQQTATEVKAYLDDNPLVQLRKSVRERYTLGRIIGEQLVPLIER